MATPPPNPRACRHSTPSLRRPPPRRSSSCAPPPRVGRCALVRIALRLGSLARSRCAQSFSRPPLDVPRRAPECASPRADNASSSGLHARSLPGTLLGPSRSSLGTLPGPPCCA
eukprot:1647622-Rhodomonas_salina.5